MTGTSLINLIFVMFSTRSVIGFSIIKGWSSIIQGKGRISVKIFFLRKYGRIQAYWTNIIGGIFFSTHGQECIFWKLFVWFSRYYLILKKFKYNFWTTKNYVTPPSAADRRTQSNKSWKKLICEIQSRNDVIHDPLKVICNRNL
jgi:hypothetical protein